MGVQDGGTSSAVPHGRCRPVLAVTKVLSQSCRAVTKGKLFCCSQSIIKLRGCSLSSNFPSDAIHVRPICISGFIFVFLFRSLWRSILKLSECLWGFSFTFDYCNRSWGSDAFGSDVTSVTKTVTIAGAIDPTYMVHGGTEAGGLPSLKARNKRLWRLC